MKKPKLIPRTEGHKLHRHGISPKMREIGRDEKRNLVEDKVRGKMY